MLLKAPWVGITQDAAQAERADNQLAGRINHIERGPEQCEVLMALPDGRAFAPPCRWNRRAIWRKGRR